ncbi:hypothetical protein G7092_17135 [Mucilaginibacter sp. HC2]|uniref:hypothetical protein n=1 Tax=Mucilaginibacter TaxID=423349 RepID=UPI000DCAEE25|nr:MULTISPECIES: hypothetical protein [Mucilaginibacter]NHA05538.1 hypothetical protein [Mucilaginibacter inviolabilis]QTE35347.1 hypothetical protein J3L18_19615 [Mucilaginibacter gossypii]RAV59452.1 hypothetical protein DIU36_06385 [Mucilaginibacter rubeus]
MKGKALILLVVFLLNTVTGFCCALHMMHEDHHELTGHHEHGHATESVTHAQIASSAVLAPNETCCQGAVNNFASLAKQVPAGNHILPLASFTYVSKPIDFFLTAPTSLYVAKLMVTGEKKRPPDKDIRVVIQSFLI